MVHTPRHQAESLLNALDPLPYPMRMRELAVHVRGLAEVRPLLDELETRGPYERGLAVVAAAVSRDAEWITARVADPDSVVRGHALRVAGSLQVPDSAYESALSDAPEAVRRQLLRAIVTGRRTALADRLVDGLREDWGDTEAARLLPGCSPETVARLLPSLFHAVRGWTLLGRWHARAVLDVAERELADLPESLRDTWWQRHARAVAVTVAVEPLRALELVERFGPAEIPCQLSGRLGEFAAVAPGRVLRLLLEGGVPAYGRVGGRSLLLRLARSGAEELAAYGRALAEAGRLVPFLRVLPPARRHAFYTESTAGRGVGGVTVDTTILEVLPRSSVAEEARRMAAAAHERGGRWDAVLLAESFLPVAEVRERLVEATRRPAAEDRAVAWPLLIRNAARSGDCAAVTSVLEESARLRNEQEPVRLPALYALSRTPPALFTENAEPHLDRIAADAVDARDSSPETRRNLSELALSVLREHAAGGSRELVNWALRTLVRISGNTGGADLGRLDARLRRGQEHQVYEALRPWIEAGAEKADYSLAFALARAVGRRAAGMLELQELLWQAVRFGNDVTARDAVGLWLEPPATRDERVARILASEPSAGALRPVLAVVTRRRTDLLDVLLTDDPPYGRFLTKGSPWTVPVDRDVRRWLPRQQAAAARRLAETAADAGLPSYARVAAITRGALVPGRGAGLVRRWTGSRDVVLAEAALGALVHTDRPGDTLPELLAHAGDDRARVAVYAAARASRHVAPSHLAGQLREVLLASDTKVTSRKEAARLAAARLPVARAVELLTEAYGRPGAHPDVRAACVAVAGPLLADDRIWTVLHDAAIAEPVLRMAVLRVQPMDLAEPHRERYAHLVRDVSAAEDRETAALAFEALARWAPWSDDAPTVLAEATADLSDRTAWMSAANGLVTAAAVAPQGGRGLLRALEALAEAETGTGDSTDAESALGAEARPTAGSVENAGNAGNAGRDATAHVGTAADPVREAVSHALPDAEEQRDRPARRRVEYLVERLTQHARTAPGPIRPAALAAGELLARYDDFVPQAATLTACHLDLDAQPQEADAALDRLAVLTDGRPALTGRIARDLSERLRRQPHEGNADALLATARRLTAHGGFAEGLLAAALTDAIGTRTGWSAAWRERLRALRRHRAPDVRDMALARATAYE